MIIDTGGNRTLADLRRVLTPRATLVIVGGEGGGRWFGGVDRSLRAMVVSPFVGQQLRGLVSAERTADIEVLRGFIEAGQVTPAIDRTFPLAEAPDAIRYLVEGRARGKIVLTV
jgi:NADPH:quinone reductase-like Zn-dependent oxidoreductase